MDTATCHTNAIPPADELYLSTIHPEINLMELQRRAQRGEVKQVLHCLLHYANRGAQSVLVNIRFPSTVDELRRRKILVEPADMGFVVSWVPEAKLPPSPS